MATTTRCRLMLMLMLVPALASGCARPVVVGSAPAAEAAVLVVANQTDWEVLIELVPGDPDTGALTLGQIAPGESLAFENVPPNRLVTLRAAVPGTARILTGPARSFAPGERWEWLIHPGSGWRLAP
jgi:hypothetical protein